MPPCHVEVEAPYAEYTQLRKPDLAAEVYWGTTVFAGSPVTFRVVDDADMSPVDGMAYLNARMQAMHTHVRSASSLHQAAELAYRSVFIEVSLLDDPLAIPGASDCAIDLWLPLHVALMTGNRPAVEALLQFHVEHAVEAMTCFANTPSAVCAAHEMGRHTASTDSPVLPSLRDDEKRRGGGIAGEEDCVRGSVGETTATTAAAADVGDDPILDCQVRRELGGTVVLLGHFDGRIRHSSCAAVRKSRPPSPVRSSTGATPLPAFAVTPIASTETTIAAAAAAAAVAPLLNSAEDAVMQSVMQHNDALLKEENALFEDKGEEYCLVNVLTALHSLLRSVVLEIERRWQAALPGSNKSAPVLRLPAVAENAIDLLRDFCMSLSSQPQHPPLLVDADVLFSLCHNGDLALLTKVMDAMEGALAPVLRGQALLTDRQSAVATAAAAAAAASTSVLHTASRDPSPHLSSLNAQSSGANVSAAAAPHVHARVQSGVSGVATPRGGSVGRHLHPPAPASFWWSCRPQQVHELAFVALWIGCREAVEESSGSGRRRRAVSISTENRVMMAAIRQLVESPVAAQKLSAMVWSGHLVTITKLLARDCTLEDFMDFVEEGGYFNVASPCGFSGPFLSVLVAGVVAAAAVRDGATLRVLRRKVETLLADVPGRPSSLRAFVAGKMLTHAERFRELWLDAGSPRNCRHEEDSGNAAAPQEEEAEDGVHGASASRRGGPAALPHKFRTRVELLYFGVVEQVLEAAEVAWTQEPEDARSVAAGAAPTSLWASGASKQEAQAALQSWVLMWNNFFTGLRDRPDHHHRRSLSYSSTSSQMAKEQQQQQQLGSSTDGQLGKEKNAAMTRDASSEDFLSEDATDVAETIRRVCRVLVDRLETGAEPLPALRRAIYPNGAADADSGVSGTATPAQMDKALPMSSIEQEFMSASTAFGDLAAKESQEVQLKFYGLFKQATKGDVNISRPGFFDYAGKAKWDAWSKLKGMSMLDAKRAYVSEYTMMIDLRKSKK